MAWLPAASVEVVNVAVPLFSVTVPRLVLPSRKVTFPVGVPAPGATALTVAVKVTAWPNADGLTEDVTVVVVLAWLTVCVSVAEVLVVKLVSPAYTAVMAWPATAKAAVVNVAEPPESVAVPSVVVPSRKVTVPLGVPVPGATAVTVAVKVTPWPNTEGLTEEVTVVVLLACLTVCVSVAEVLVVK